jgi:hypothetical protein
LTVIYGKGEGTHVFEKGFRQDCIGGTAPGGAGAAKVNSKINGVQIGLQSYSFRDRPMAKAIEACKEVGLGEVELWQGHVEPQTTGTGAREELRKWRLETPLDTFANVRKQWNDAGIELYAYNLSFNNSFSDAEIDRGFEMAKAMGVKVLTASSTVSAARKVAPFADKHKIQVAMHAATSPTGQFAAQSFAAPGNSSISSDQSRHRHFVSAGYMSGGVFEGHQPDRRSAHQDAQSACHPPLARGKAPKEVLSPTANSGASRPTSSTISVRAVTEVRSATST